MELPRTPTRLDSLIIENHIPGGSSNNEKELKTATSSDGRITTTSSTTQDLDQHRRLLEQAIDTRRKSQIDLEKQTQETIKSPSFIIQSKLAHITGCIPSPTSKKLAAKIALVEDSQEDLDIVAQQFGTQKAEDLFNEITEDPVKITVLNMEQGVKEEAPIAQSFKFGIVIRKELEQLQQKTIVHKLTGNIGDYSKINPLGDMLTDLARTHENHAKYSLIEGPTIIPLNQQKGQDNLVTFQRFVGEENNHLQLAIASLMHQGGQADFERIKLGAPRDSQQTTSLPFFTRGINAEMWRPSLDGPIFMKLSTGDNTTESQSYDLQKFTTQDRPPIFRLTITSTQSVADPDFNYTLTRDVTYQFEVNHAFNTAEPISEINSPVTVTCLEGKILQSFQDIRTPDQFNYQAAQYNLTVYQNKLKALGDPHQIETAYQNRIQILTSRAAARSGSIMTEDRNAAEAKLKQLRKAQQDVAKAQQAAAHFQKKLDGLFDDNIYD